MTPDETVTRDNGTADGSHARRAASRERQRRSRERRRNGIHCTIYLDVRRREVEELVERGLLRRDEVHDRATVAFAMGRLLDDMLAQ
jgi:hypothetical protein